VRSASYSDPEKGIKLGTSLVPRPSRKVERRSGVLSNFISCRAGPVCKDHNCILNLELVLSDSKTAL